MLGFVNKFNRGIDRVQRELQNNGNGSAKFTVNDITVFSVNVPAPDRVNDIVKRFRGEHFEQLDFSEKAINLLRKSTEGWFSQSQLLEGIGVTNQTNNVRNHLRPLIEEGLIVKSDTRTNRQFYYTITEKGIAYLAYLSKMELLTSYLEE